MQDYFYKFILISNKNDTSLGEYLKFIKVCAESGITAIQLREKNATYVSLMQFSQSIKKILAPLNIPLIINDNLKLAIDVDADGVHLGQTDGDPQIARKLLGINKIIGVSINSFENLERANNLPIDYVGVGAVFPTRNKINISTILGLDGLKKLSLASKHRVVAIGGINESNACEVMVAGADGIATIGALHDVYNPSLTAKKLRHIVDTRGKDHA